MADSVSLVFRPMFLEDLAQSATLAQTTSPILNVGPSVAVTPFLAATSDASAVTAGAAIGSVYLNTSVVPWQLKAVSNINFIYAANDTAAITAGAQVGTVYVNNSTTPWQLKAVSGLDFGISYGTVTLANLTSQLIATNTVAGAVVGNSISFGTNPALPTGVQLVMKVTAPNTVTAELWNLSGATQVLLGFLATGRVIQWP